MALLTELWNSCWTWKCTLKAGNQLLQSFLAAAGVPHSIARTAVALVGGIARERKSEIRQAVAACL
eukprot:6014307-Amphidinium_carterae.2